MPKQNADTALFTKNRRGYWLNLGMEKCSKPSKGAFS